MWRVCIGKGRQASKIGLGSSEEGEARDELQEGFGIMSVCLIFRDDRREKSERVMLYSRRVLLHHKTTSRLPIGVSDLGSIQSLRNYQSSTRAVKQKKV